MTRFSMASASSTSGGNVTSSIAMPSFPAASFKVDRVISSAAVSGVTRVTRRRFGRSALRISSRLPSSANERLVCPVRFPPGRESDCTRPTRTGSPTPRNTMGISRVRSRNSNASREPVATMTSGRLATTASARASTWVARPDRFTISTCTSRPGANPSAASAPTTYSRTRSANPGSISMKSTTRFGRAAARAAKGNQASVNAESSWRRRGSMRTG